MGRFPDSVYALNESLLDEVCKRRVVVYVPRVVGFAAFFEDAAVPMIGVFAEADVGDDEKIFADYVL